MECIIETFGAEYGKEYPIDCIVTADNSLFTELGATFVSDVAVKGRYVLYENEVELSLSVSFTLSFSCHSCGDEATRTFIGSDFKEVFSKEKDGSIVEVGANGVMDIGALVSECVVFSVPPKLLCKDDCKGICPLCHTNLNRSECTCVEVDYDEDNPFAILHSLKR